MFNIDQQNHSQGERNEASRGALRVFGAEFRRSLGEGEWEKTASSQFGLRERYIVSGRSKEARRKWLS
jgi:hypothetical protein